ncbi:hypothetical protein [Flavobacterium sp.]|uniref:toxin-antitoxin system YwqK family antitoxin n=1 Tax=Flavobacterium sp. TaxID=239 RepID=UPI00286E8FA0|nr:hypothetical protein [Flavobacterium sp.]
MKKVKQSEIFMFLLTFCITVSYAQIEDAKVSKGLRHGKQKGYYENSNILRYEGNFNNGKEQGLFTYYAESDKIIVMATRNFDGKNNAYTIFFDEKGNKVSEGNAKNRLREGIWTYYHNTSKEVMTIENYKKDKLEGSRKVFYITGKLAEEVFYKNDLKEGVSKKYSKESKLVEESVFKNGLLQGSYKVFDESGNQVISGQFDKDLKKGLWKYYAGGKLIRQVNVDTIKGIIKPQFRKKE